MELWASSGLGIYRWSNLKRRCDQPDSFQKADVPNEHPPSSLKAEDSQRGAMYTWGKL